jgi:hypothetical protein
MDTGLIILFIVFAFIAYGVYQAKNDAGSAISSIPIVGGLFSKLGGLV